MITVEAAQQNLGDYDFWSTLQRQSNDCEPLLQDGQAPFLLMCTSGTTGPAKPLEVPLRALLAFKGYMHDAVELRADDRFWNLADPGWAYGLYYSVTGPLALGHATLFYDGPFSVDSTCWVINKYAITNLAGSPTAFRLLISTGMEFADSIQGRLRVVSSAGEPLNPQVIRWFAEQRSASFAAANAMLCSPIETAKANGQEPYGWLRHVLERLPQAESVEDFEALLLWNRRTS